MVYLADAASLKEKAKIELKKNEGFLDYKGKVIFHSYYETNYVLITGYNNLPGGR